MKKLLAVAAFVVTMATGANAAPNLLVNGDFESYGAGNVASSWVFGTNGNVTKVYLAVPPGGYFSPSGVKDGTRRAQWNSSDILVSSANYWIAQSFTTVVGHKYDVSGWLAGGQGNGGPALNGTTSWIVSWKNGGTPTNVGQVTSSTSVFTKNLNFTGQTGQSFSWTSMSSQFTATSTQSALILRTQTNISSSVGMLWSAYFDAFSVTDLDAPPPAPVPEPVFFQMGALVGMGGLGLLRLRRKSA